MYQQYDDESYYYGSSTSDETYASPEEESPDEDDYKDLYEALVHRDSFSSEERAQHGSLNDALQFIRDEILVNMCKNDEDFEDMFSMITTEYGRVKEGIYQFGRAEVQLYVYMQLGVTDSSVKVVYNIEDEPADTVSYSLQCKPSCSFSKNKKGRHLFYQQRDMDADEMNDWFETLVKDAMNVSESLRYDSGVYSFDAYRNVREGVEVKISGGQYPDGVWINLVPAIMTSKQINTLSSGTDGQLVRYGPLLERKWDALSYEDVVACLTPQSTIKWRLSFPGLEMSLLRDKSRPCLPYMMRMLKVLERFESAVRQGGMANVFVPNAWILTLNNKAWTQYHVANCLKNIQTVIDTEPHRFDEFF